MTDWLREYIKAKDKENFFEQVLWSRQRVEAMHALWEWYSEDLEVISNVLSHEYIVNSAENKDQIEAFKLWANAMIDFMKDAHLSIQAEKIEEEIEVQVKEEKEKKKRNRKF